MPKDPDHGYVSPDDLRDDDDAAPIVTQPKAAGYDSTDESPITKQPM